MLLNIENNFLKQKTKLNDNEYIIFNLKKIKAKQKYQSQENINKVNKLKYNSVDNFIKINNQTPNKSRNKNNNYFHS